MNPIIGCDAQRRYSLFAVLNTSTLPAEQTRVNHHPGAIREFLSDYPEGTPVAIETVGNYYWIVDEIEQAGCVPLLAHAAKAKVIMGNINKTDKLDAKGLATMVHLGSLPTVWLPPGEIRDERERSIERAKCEKKHGGQGDNTDMGYKINHDTYTEFLAAFGHSAHCSGNIRWVERAPR